MSSQPQWDEVSHYRLTISIIDEYLKTLFPSHTTFYTEVSCPNNLLHFRQG